MIDTFASIFSYRDWLVSLAIDRRRAHGLEGYADLQRQGAYIGRLAYASSSQNADEALELLVQEVKAFVDVWPAQSQELESVISEA